MKLELLYEMFAIPVKIIYDRAPELVGYNS